MTIDNTIMPIIKSSMQLFINYIQMKHFRPMHDVKFNY